MVRGRRLVSEAEQIAEPMKERHQRRRIPGIPALEGDV
jgi:hypothetical protein